MFKTKYLKYRTKYLTKLQQLQTGGNVDKLLLVMKHTPPGKPRIIKYFTAQTTIHQLKKYLQVTVPEWRRMKPNTIKVMSPEGEFGSRQNPLPDAFTLQDLNQDERMGLLIYLVPT
jgi:hypothetical protein